jgi:hypothetical protein
MRTKTTRRPRQSTAPGEWLIGASLAGDPSAKAILESFRVPFWSKDVIVLSPEQFDAAIERGRTTFAFERIDDSIMVTAPPALDELESEQTAVPMAA